MAKAQLKIKGTEPQRIRELEVAAEHLLEVRAERMKLTEAETEATNAVLSAMEKHRLSVYRDDEASLPLLIQVIPGKARVKVSEVREEEADDEVPEL